MAKKNHAPDFQIGNLSDVGKMRDENQDFFGSYNGEFGRLIVVCDGMGGHQGGSVASRIAVQVFQSHFEGLRSNYDSHFELEAAFHSAQQKILDHANEHPETKGMGTTAAILLVRDDKWWAAHTGDSRIYLKRSKQIRQITKDHSWVQGMVDGGILSPAQAAQHPKRNIITKALGTKDFMPDIQGPFTLGKGDTFLLCSDGLYEYFNEKELSKLMDDDPQSACQNMINLANQRGGSDNITVQILRSNIGDKPEPLSKPNYLNLIILGVSVLALILAGFVLFRTTRLMRKAKRETIVAPDSTATKKKQELPSEKDKEDKDGKEDGTIKIQIDKADFGKVLDSVKPKDAKDNPPKDDKAASQPARRKPETDAARPAKPESPKPAAGNR